MSRKRNYDPAVKLTWDAAYRERNRSTIDAGQFPNPNLTFMDAGTFNG